MVLQRTNQPNSLHIVAIICEKLRDLNNSSDSPREQGTFLFMWLKILARSIERVCQI
jgi:hypothetical protein